MKRTLRPRVAALGLADVLSEMRSTALPKTLGRQGESAARRHTSSRRDIQTNQINLAYREQRATMACVL